MFSEKFGWQPIDTAPVGKDVMLMVTDGQGEPYAVLKPFKLTAALLPSRPCIGGHTLPAKRNGDATCMP